MGVNTKSHIMITGMARLLNPPINMVLLGSQRMRPTVKVKHRSARKHYMTIPSLFRQVICIDINGKDSCYDQDLSVRLRDWAMDEWFDLLYNGGTLEHVENQREAWRNAHYLLRPGGVAVHVCPLVGGWRKHSDYLYMRSFFDELVAANNYKMAIMPQVVQHPKGEALYIAFRKEKKSIFHWKQAAPFAVKQV